MDKLAEDRLKGSTINVNFAHRRGINNENVLLLLQQSNELLDIREFQQREPGATEMKPLVLVCSRDAGLYLMISHILKVDGFDCLHAGNLDEVAEILSQHPVAVILLDCNDRFFVRPGITASNLLSGKRSTFVPQPYQNGCRENP